MARRTIALPWIGRGDQYVTTEITTLWHWVGEMPVGLDLRTKVLNRPAPTAVWCSVELTLSHPSGEPAAEAWLDALDAYLEGKTKAELVAAEDALIGGSS